MNLKKYNIQGINDLVGAFLREEGLETPLYEYRIVNAWNEVMGQTVSRYTSEIYVRNSLLYVKLKSPALKQNLLMMHHDIAQKLNMKVGRQTIVDVRFI